MLIQEDNFLLINTIIFSIIGLVILLVLLFSIVIAIKNVKPDLCNSCCKKGSGRKTKVQSISGNKVKDNNEEERKKSSVVGQYLTLEDHLDNILETPIKKVSKVKESHGYTLEFFPDDNTVVQIEGTNNKITKITKTKITFGDKISESKECSVFTGELNDSRILIYIIKLNDKVYNDIKTHIMHLDRGLPILTQHPRYLRYLGTCFNPQKLESYIISDYAAGCSLLDLQKNSLLRELLGMSEEDKLQAAVDVVEAVYYIHNLSSPKVHHNISARNIVIDGETLRARLRSPEIQDRLDEMLWCLNHGGVKDFYNRSSILQIELAPELFLQPSQHPDIKSDIWSLGAAVLEILFDKKLWNDQNLSDKLGEDQSSNIFEILKKAMSKRMKPCLLDNLEQANQKLRFLSDALSYTPSDRPSAVILLKSLQQFQTEVKESRSSQNSIIYPSKRLKTSVARTRTDPLLRQQVEWNVRQESGVKRRAFLVGNRNYLGRHWQTLSANPTNDIKDLENVLRRGGYATQNVYENVSSSANFEEILSCYVEAVNKENDDIDIIIFYFAGYGVVGEPEKLKAKKALNIYTDRQGFINDTALVMCNESLVSVAKIQVLISQLSGKVKRKMIILDTRVSALNPKTSSSMTPEELLQRTLMRTQSTYSTISGYQVMFTTSTSSTASSTVSSEKTPVNNLDWELPKIPEEATEKLNSMFILKTVVTDAQVILKAVDSHPRRMNGFLTGCLLQVLQDHTPNISDIPKFLNNQMKTEARRSRAHRGIECKAEFSRVGNIWSAPLLPQ